MSLNIVKLNEYPLSKTQAEEWGHDKNVIAAVAAAKCPDCGGQLLEGPHGGAMMNVMCDACCHKFNVPQGYDLLVAFGVSRI